MLRERCNPNPDGDIEGGPKPTEKIIIKYAYLIFVTEATGIPV